VRRLLAVCAIAFATMIAQPAMAQAPEDDLIPLQDEDLQGLRGGFLVAEGVAFEFGATMRTLVDGGTVLETRLTWTPDGPIVEQLSGLPLQGTAGGGFGLTIGDGTGLTTIGHRLLDGELQGFILNTADNRDIRQNLDITLTLPGFDAVQRDLLISRLGVNINYDLGVGLVEASRD
jgi:hypothetical protein